MVLRSLASLILGLLLAPAVAAEYPQATPKPLRPVSIVIDDLGFNAQAGQRVLNLPGPVACAMLPLTKHAIDLAEGAFASGKEVMLHLPLQPLSRRTRAGPGALTQYMPRHEIVTKLRQHLARFPHLAGVNNHMGSRMTADAQRMQWVMGELQNHNGLFFLDSRTTSRSVAYATAQAYGIPSTDRDIFLDHNPSREAVDLQLERFIDTAYARGSAVAIGHPYPSTLAALEEWIPLFDQMGVQLVSMQALIAWRRDHPQARLAHAR